MMVVCKLHVYSILSNFQFMFYSFLINDLV